MYALVGKIKLHRKNGYSPEVHGHIEYAIADRRTSLFCRVGAMKSPSVSGTDDMPVSRGCLLLGFVKQSGLKA